LWARRSNSSFAYVCWDLMPSMRAHSQHRGQVDCRENRGYVMLSDWRRVDGSSEMVGYSDRRVRSDSTPCIDTPCRPSQWSFIEAIHDMSSCGWINSVLCRVFVIQHPLCSWTRPVRTRCYRLDLSPRRFWVVRHERYREHASKPSSPGILLGSFRFWCKIAVDGHSTRLYTGSCRLVVICLDLSSTL